MTSGQKLPNLEIEDSSSKRLICCAVCVVFEI
jgi:hypothetical protein